MIDSVCVVGAGRAGSALGARLEERGVSVSVTGRSLQTGSAGHVLLCVPDRAIAEVAPRIEPGPWVGHASGVTPLAALAPHVRRFALHPLQALTPGCGPHRLDGAWAAIGGESPEALEQARALAAALGMPCFEVADRDRAAYHAAGAFAANFAVTLYHAGARLLASAGAPAEALGPLLAGVAASGYQLTGPIARGDRGTVEAHLATLRERTPELEPAYRALAELTVTLVPGARAEALPEGALRS